jgi:hypothetical protein
MVDCGHFGAEFKGDKRPYFKVVNTIAWNPKQKNHMAMEKNDSNRQYLCSFEVKNGLLCINLTLLNLCNFLKKI